MARYLFAVWPFAGHVHPAIAIAHALRGRGHEIGFYSGSAVGEAIIAEGFAFFPFQKLDERRVTELAATDFPYSPSLWHRIRTAKRLQSKFREWLLDTIPQQVEDIDGVMTQWRPDVLICDLAFWSPFLILHEARRIPVAVLSILAACILPGPDVPFWGQGVPRPRNAAMRLRTKLQHGLLRILSKRFRGAVDEMRRRYGLAGLGTTVTEHAAKMPLYLVPSAREYDYNRRDLPPSVQYVGPCLWDKPTKAAPPRWLDDLPAGEPLIYVTEATIGTSEPFLLKAAALALANLPVQVVMTAGRQRCLADLNLGTLAPNIRIESYVPQSDLLPRTAVMVTLGGSGGVLAALREGVPLLIVPTEWDRPENAQRVVEAGAGIRIAPKDCTPERLRAAVQRLLDEPEFRRNAERLSQAFEQYDGPARAAALLEGLQSRPVAEKVAVSAGAGGKF